MTLTRTSAGALASLATIAGLLGDATQAREATTPLSVYGHLPHLEDLALSPDGKRIAFVRTSGDSRSVLIVNLSENAPSGGARVGETKLRSIQWQDDNTLLAIVSQTSPPPMGFFGSTSEWFMGVRYTLDDKRIHALDFGIDHEETFNTISGSISMRMIDGKSMLYVPGLYVDAPRVLPALFCFNPQGRARIVARASEPNTDWLVGPDGRVAADLTYHDDRQIWELRARRDAGMVRVATGHAAIDVPEIIGFSGEGDAVIVEFPKNGVAQWRAVSLKDGAIGEPLAQGEELHGAIEDRRNGRIIGGFKGADERGYVFFDNEMQAHWDALLRGFPNERVTLVSASDDYARIVVRVFGDKDGYSYHLFDWYSHKTYRLGPVYEGLTQPGEVRAISYKAADELPIPAILTLPAGMEAKSLPLVVLPHGGPAAHDTLGFDWWGQAIADQGYAVLQPNYRGSTLSASFLEAGYGEWGRKMQSDLSDGVAYLAREGIIDPKRVCIVGGSYGGYAALAGATLQPDVYRCAVSVAGIGDLGRMRDWIGRNRTGASTRYWDRFLGIAQHDDREAKAISPIEHVKDVKTPVLLIHGKDDTVVPYEQSTEMEKALKRAGKQVTFVTLKHEDHWLSRSETRLQMLEAMVAFLKANNPP